jgi:hypothetical protein
MRAWACFGVIAGSCLAAGLAADPAAGLQDFQLGQKFQAARQWGSAARQYSKTLQDDPKAYWAYKALGTVYYQAGDHRGALSYYHRYLALNPSDGATQAFAARLQAELGGYAPAAATTAVTPAVTPAAQAADNPASHGGFGIRVEGDEVLNNGADLASLFTAPGQTAGTTGGLAAGYGLGVDYTTDSGFMMGLDAMEGPTRHDTLVITNGSGSGTLQTAIDSSIFGADAGWRFGIGHYVMVEPNLGLDYMMSTLSITGSNATASASGFAAWPKVRAEFVWKWFGIGLDAGYLWAQLSPVKGSNGVTVQQTSPSGSTSTWVMNNGGLSLGLYAAYHFTVPL